MAEKSFVYDIKLNVDKSNLNSIENALKEIQKMTASDLMNIDKNLNTGEAIEKLRQVKNTVGELQSALKNAYNVKLGSVDISKFNKEIEKSNLDINVIRKELTSVGSVGSSAFRNLTTSLLTTNLALKESDSLLSRMATTMGNTVKWGISSSIMNSFTGSVQKAYSYVERLDKSLNNIRIVSGQSASQMEVFAKEANKAAKALGTSTTEYTNASQIFYQQGLSGKDVTDRSDVVIKMSNATKDAAEDVSSYMTAIWNNFDNGSKSLEHYADVITALGASTASSSSEIAEGLEKFAAVAQTVGLSYEYATSALATVVATTRQSADTVGTAFKTLFARIESLKLGDTLDDGTTLAKYSEALKKVGINIKDADGQLKDMDVILDEMGEKWNSLSKDQQIALAQAVAGVRQYNQLIALMANYDDFKINLQTAATATGELNKQQKTYMESLEAHQETMRANYERLYSAMFDKEALTGIYDMLGGIAKLGAEITESLGGGTSTLLALGSTGLKVFKTQIAQGLSATITNLSRADNNAKTLQARFELINKLKINPDSSHLMELVQMEEEVLNYGKLVTAEEHNEAAAIIGTKNEILNEAEAWEQKLNNAREYLSLTSGSDVPDLNNIDNSQIADSITEMDAFAQSMKDTQTEAQYLGKELTKLNVVAVSKDATKTANAMDSITSSGKKLGKQVEELLNSQKLEEKELERLSSAYKAYQEAIENGENNGIFSDEDILKIRNFIAAFEEVSNNIQTKTSEAKDVIDRETNGASENFKTKIKECDGEYDKFINRLKTKSKIETFSNMVGSVGQLASSFMALKNVFDGGIWGDDTLSTGEKILQTITAIGIAIPMIVTSIKGLATGMIVMTGLATATEVAAMSFTQLAAAAGTALLTLAPYIAAIGAVVGVIALFVKSANDAKKADEELAKAEEEAKESFDRAADAYQNLKNTISDWQNSYKSIKKLEKGTMEFYEALVKANEKAKELIESYGLIAGQDYTIDDNGAIVIEDAAQKRLIKEQQRQTYQAQMGYFQTKKDSNAIKKADILSSFAKEFSENYQTISLKTAQQMLTGEAGNYKIEDEHTQEEILRAIREGNESNDKNLKNVSKNIVKSSEGTAKTADISDMITKYKSQYNEVEAYEEALEKMIKDSYMKAYGTLEDQDKYKDLTTKQQEYFNDFAYTGAKTVVENAGGIDRVETGSHKNKNWKGNLGVLENPEILDNDYYGGFSRVQFMANAGLFDSAPNVREAAKNKQWAGSNKGWYIEAYQNEYDKQKGQIAASTTSEEFKDAYKIGKIKTFSMEDVLSDLESAYDIYAQQSGYTYDRKTGLFSADGDAFDEEKQKTIRENAINAWKTGGVYAHSSMNYYDKYLGYIDKQEDAYDQAHKTDKFTDEKAEFYKEFMTKMISNRDDPELEKRLNLFDDDEIEKIKTIVEGSRPEYGITDSVNGLMNRDVFAPNFEGQQQSFLSYYERRKNGEEGYQYDAEAVKREKEQRFIDETKKQAGELGVGEKGLEAYARALEKSRSELDGLTRSTAKAAAENYKFNKTYNESADIFDDVSDVYDNWLKCMKKGTDPTWDMVDAIQQVADSLEALGLNLDVTQLETYSSDIKKLFQGTQKEAEAAYKNLLKYSIANNLKEIKDSLDFSEIGMNDGFQNIDDIASTLSNLGNGISLDEAGLSEFQNQLIKYVNASEMTVGQVEKLFAGMNIEMPEIEVPETPELVQDVYETNGSRTKHTYSGEMIIPDGKGGYKKETLDYSWYEEIAPKKEAYVHFDEGTKLKTRTNNINTKRDTAGSKGKGSGGGGGSKSKEKPIKAEINPYQRVDEELARISNQLSLLEKQKARLFGKKEVENLAKQVNLLNKEIDTTNKKIGIAIQERDRYGQDLAGTYGIKFDSNNLITNYADVWKNEKDKVDAAIAAYNKSKQSEKDKEKLEAAKERFSQFEELIDKYDETINSTIPQLQQQIEEDISKIIESKISIFDVKVQLTLDLDALKKQWEEFKKDVLENIDDKDILGNAKYNFNRYKQIMDSGQLSTLSTHLTETIAEGRLMQQGKQSSIFGTTTTDKASGQTVLTNDWKQWVEEAKKSIEDLENVMKELDELQEELHDNLIDSLGETKDYMDSQTELYDAAISNLQHNLKLVQLTYGEKAYSQMSNYYSAITDTYKREYDKAVGNTAYWKQLMETYVEGTEEWEAARDNWLDSVATEQAALESYMDSVTEKYINSINEIFDNLNNKITNGKGLEYINEEWGLINKQADMYLDTIDAQFGIQQLQNKYLDAIDKTNNVEIQQKLTGLMNEQVDALKKQDKLSQYDLDRANKKYEIALKEIELQEAQMNKSTMRLRRDSQGNYTYQYAADEDKLAQLQDELSALKNELYNLDKDAYKENLNQIYSIWSEYQEKMAEAAQINDPEERLEREELLTEYYGEMINDLVGDNEELKQNLYESTYLSLVDLYGKESDAVHELEADQDATMGRMVVGWNSKLQEMTDSIRDEGGFEQVYKETLEKLEAQTIQYQQVLDEVKTKLEEENAAQTNVDTTLNTLIETTDAFIQQAINSTEDIEDYIKEVKGIAAAYEEVSEKAKQALIDANAFVTGVYEQNIADAPNGVNDVINKINEQAPPSTPEPTPPSTPTPAPKSEDNSKYRLGGKEYTIKKGDTLSAIAKKYYGKASLYTEIWANNKDHMRGKNANYIYPGEVIKLNTGGYTGDWSGSDGRMAMLHKKELVLNANDTANLLNTISILREMTQSMLGNRLSAGSIGGSLLGSGLEQNVHIEASFPNVTSHSEIEEALNNLVNVAAQRVQEK